MKKFLVLVLLLSIFISGYTSLDEVTPIAMDTYTLTLHLRVPQVFANTTSQGYRKYQVQRIKGDMNIIWMSDGTFSFEFDKLVNNTFKVGGSKVTYTGFEGREMVYPRFNWIGNNRTDSFQTACLSFYLELEPSYSKGGNNEDNSFYLMMAGKGGSSYKSKLKSRIATYFSGYSAGTQGCGCMAYEHKSPTRKATVVGPLDTPEDVVAAFGQWRARWNHRTYF